MTISIQAAKSKGRNLQKLIRDRILALFPALEPDDVVSCPMGSSGVDIRLSPAAKLAFPFAVECKARAKLSAYSWLKQACGHGRTPLLVMKGDRQPALVVMYLEDWIKLFEKSRKP